jgi:hypothetical protein
VQVEDHRREQDLGCGTGHTIRRRPSKRPEETKAAMIDGVGGEPHLGKFYTSTSLSVFVLFLFLFLFFSSFISSKELFVALPNRWLSMGTRSSTR